MSTRGRDLVTVPRGDDEVNYIVGDRSTKDEYLSSVSPKHKPWDQHRGEADDVAGVYAASPIGRHHRYGDRVAQCSQILGFAARPLLPGARDPPGKTSKQKLKLTKAWFCRVRHCPVCQWRRSLMWQAKVYRALPRLVADFPQVRFLFITLTVRNCPVQVLRQQLILMGRAWARLTELKIWPAIGWVRSLEITRGRDGGAHPHYHTLLMVQPEYFRAGYLKQREWADLWQRCLRIEYRPIVDVRVVNPDHRMLERQKVVVAHIWGALAEVLKYSIKPSDMIHDHEWFLTLVDQVWKMRAVAIGGVLKKYLKERDKENLTSEPGEELSEKEAEQLFFGWKQQVRRYRKLGTTPV
jgi:plasmid rolling circle replication initiator protein Rep